MPPKKRQLFMWTLEAKTKLAEIATTLKNAPNKWIKIHQTFCRLYPSYHGNDGNLKTAFYKTHYHSSSIQDFLRTLSPIRVIEFEETVDLIYAMKRAEKKQYLHDVVTSSFPNTTFTADELWMYAIMHGQKSDSSSQQCVFESVALSIRNGAVSVSRNCSIAQQYRSIVKLFREHYDQKHGHSFEGSDYYILQKVLPSLAFVPARQSASLNNISEASSVMKYMDIGDKLSKIPIFKEMCHNCGYMLYRLTNKSKRILLDNPLNSQLMVREHFDLPDNFPSYMSPRGKFVLCGYCKINPHLHQEYSRCLPNSNKIGIPKELEVLTESEKSQIALCGVFSIITQFANNYRKLYKECQGHVNIGKKRSKSYYGNFTTYYNTARPDDLPSSGQRIRAALLWLKRHNHLYTKFYSNYETLYGYLTRALKINVNDTTIELAHGEFADIIRNESRGALLPADNVTIDETILQDDRVAIQHPIFTTAKTAFDENKSAIKVSYRDPDLEAKAWPADHPTGTGSWKEGGSLTNRQHWKWNVFNYDSRFRNNQERHFFTFDRYLKSKLRGYNFARVVNTSNLEQQITAEEIKENEGFYGSVVPSSIPGSPSYWASKTYELLAMVKELGRPALFVTLTQNDNWPELQIAAGHLTKEELVDLEPGEFHPPPVIGSGICDHPLEAVLAFHERFLEVFMKEFVNKKDGPFGTVTDHWYRLEYQQRGAVHAHVLLWIDPGTFNPDCISAELPRYNGSDETLMAITKQARQYVEAFQLHNCIPARCFTNRKQEKLKKCKMGFPFTISKETELPEKQVRYLYRRRSDEDSRVVPYNLELLLAMQSHVNVQMVTDRSLEFYLTKYITKPEQSFQAKIDTGNDVDKFLKYRVLGILECLNILLEFAASYSSREVVFLPTEIEPAYRMLKRKAHLPKDSESTDIYYGTIWDKYLNRPIAVRHLTYPDFWRQFDVTSIAKDNRKKEADFTQATQAAESEMAETASFTQQNKEFYDVGYLRYMRRNKSAVPRWRFLLPFGDNNEKFYEQLYMLRVPVHRMDLGQSDFDWFSPSNQSRTFMEECVIRQLVAPETDVLEVLQSALQTGFNEEKFFELVRHLINQNWIAEDQVEAIVQPFLEQMAEFQKGVAPDLDNDEDVLDEMFANQKEIIPVSEYKKQMTPSQLKAIEWFEARLAEEGQILAIVSGGGGVGKSYFLSALVSLLMESKQSSAVVAPTGTAAYLVGGKTIHNFLKLDINGKSYLQQGTVASTIVNTTDAVIVDEFSMTGNALFDQVDTILQEFSNEKDSEGDSGKLFGSRHMVLIGDPAQLESVDEGIFSNPLLHHFSVLLLKEIVRQKDPLFASMLSRIRLGKLNDEDRDLLVSRMVEGSDVDYSEDSTVLVAHNVEVERWNSIFLKKISGDEITIEAEDFHFDSTSFVHPGITKQIEMYGKANLSLKLSIKKGCVVVLTRAQGEGWPKGSRARVIAIGECRKYLILESLDGSNKRIPLRKTREEVKWKSTNNNRRYVRVQFPIRLGYSRNIHDVQGQSLSKNVYIKLDKTMWASGQAYVALSRCTELPNLKLLSFDPESIILSPEYLRILEWMEKVDEIGEIKQQRRPGDFPLVKQRSKTSGSVFPRLNIGPKISAIFNRKPATQPIKKPAPVQYTKKTVNIYEEEVEVLTDNPPNSSPRPVSNWETARVKFREAVNSEAPRSTQLCLANDFCISLYTSASRSLPNPPYRLRANDDGRRQHFSDVRNVLNNRLVVYAEDLGLVNELFRSQGLAVYSGQARDTISPEQLPAPINSELQATSIHGDGNCFYYAMSMALFGNVQYATTLRLLLACELLGRADRWTQFLATTQSNNSFDHYLFEAFHNGSWANQDHIFGMSALLGRPINVLGQFSSIAIESTTLQQINGLLAEWRAGTHHARYQFDTEPVNMLPVTIHHVGLNPGDIANHFTAMLPRTQDRIVHLNITEMFENFRNFNFGSTTPAVPVRRNRIAGGFRRLLKPGLLVILLAFLLIFWAKNTSRKNAAFKALYEDIPTDDLQHHEVINPKTLAQSADELIQWITRVLTPDHDSDLEKNLVLSSADVIPELAEEFAFVGRFAQHRQ